MSRYTPIPRRLLTITPFRIGASEAAAACRLNQEKRAYTVVSESSGGEVRWNTSRLPVDQLQRKSSLTGGNFALERLRLSSGKSLAEIKGLLAACLLSGRRRDDRGVCTISADPE
jgi:hypothetical protein